MGRTLVVERHIGKQVGVVTKFSFPKLPFDNFSERLVVIVSGFLILPSEKGLRERRMLKCQNTRNQRRTGLIEFSKSAR